MQEKISLNGVEFNIVGKSAVDIAADRRINLNGVWYDIEACKLQTFKNRHQRRKEKAGK